MYARFEVFKSFLCVFMSVFRVFIRNELWVKLPVAIFFGTVDWQASHTAEFQKTAVRQESTFSEIMRWAGASEGLWDHFAHGM